MVSSKAKYGIRAVLFIAQQSKESKRAGAKEIALAAGSPLHFTSKVLNELVKGGVIKSNKGPNGGFEMTKYKRQNTSIKDIVIALDGSGIYTNCVLGLTRCSESTPCPMHDSHKQIRQLLELTHIDKKVEELSDLLNGDYHLVLT